MTERVFNCHEVRDLRRKLRQNQTQVEKMFWSKVRGNQLGVKFRRQYSVKQFVIDFYAPEVRLAIELDGAMHFTDEAQVRDAEHETLISPYSMITHISAPL